MENDDNDNNKDDDHKLKIDLNLICYLKKINFSFKYFS